MTAVIGNDCRSRYVRHIVVRDDVQSVAAALLEPRRDYVARVARVRDALANRSVEGARALTVFLDRISDLDADELRELYDETFHPRWSADLRRTASELACQRATPHEARAVLGVLTSALIRLDGDRNPFAYVVRALYCLVRARLNTEDQRL